MDTLKVSGTVLAIGLVLAGCNDESVAPETRHLVALSVEPQHATAVAPGGRATFHAVGTFDEAPIQDDNMSVRWDTTNPSVVTIDEDSGVATCATTSLSVAITAFAVGKQGPLTAYATLSCAAPPPGSCAVAITNEGEERLALTGSCVGIRGGVCTAWPDAQECPIGAAFSGERAESCNYLVDTRTTCWP